MSYRHSSYRKMSAAVKKANKTRGEGGDPAWALTRAEMDRVLHWSNMPALPKPAWWGKPRGQRAVQL